MISLVPERRRAEEFASLVDAATTQDTPYADLLELVSGLRAVPAVQPRADYVASLREQLMAEADTALVRQDARLELHPTAAGRGSRRLATLVGAAAVIGASTSVAVAAQSALPGDTLYPIKRVIESAQTSLEPGQEARAASMLERANTRLAEAEALVERGESPEVTADALADFATQAGQAGDLALSAYDETGDRSQLEGLRDFVAATLGELAALEPVLPAALGDELGRAVSVLLGLDARALAACPECGGALDVPVTLVSAIAGLGTKPTLAPSTTLAPAGQAPAAAPTDPLSALLAALPQPNALPSVPSAPVGGGQTTPSPTSPTAPAPGDVTTPLTPSTDPLLGQDGLLGGTLALDGLLGGITGPLGEDGLLG